jgi:hypothetical protein
MDTSTVIEALRFLTCLVARHAQAKARSASSRYATQIRSKAFRDAAFQTVSIAFALVLFAQVGFIVHLISFLDPVIGRERAAIAVALLTAMAMAGRVLFSTVRPVQPAAGFGDLVCQSGRGGASLCSPDEAKRNPGPA